MDADETLSVEGTKERSRVQKKEVICDANKKSNHPTTKNSKEEN
jgi:hypothetical protein